MLTIHSVVTSQLIFFNIIYGITLDPLIYSHIQDSFVQHHL
jgi:hypothetical protein